MATPIITEKDVRVFLMDKPEMNPLLGGLKFDSQDIEQAMINVVDHFNASIPLTVNYTVENFPSRYIMLIGVAGYLLKSAAVNEAINQFDYSVEGVTVQDKNKAAIFTQLGTAFWDEFKELSKNIKIAQQVNSIYGTFHSEYNWTL